MCWQSANINVYVNIIISIIYYLHKLFQNSFVLKIIMIKTYYEDKKAKKSKNICI